MSMRARLGRDLFLSSAVGLTAIILIASSARAQWQLGSKDGDTLRLGYLIQVRAESETQDAVSGETRNLFFRHARFLFSGKVQHSISFFMGTDSPNLGKTQKDGTKNNGAIGIYDMWLTYDAENWVKVDMGLIGTPNSHNSIQSISGMLASDFGPYSFVSSPPTESKAGRDYGAQARGYILGDHLEYRAGVFEGFRGIDATKPLRFLGRLVVGAFPVEKSVYYAGTSLGTRKNLSLGLSVDHQDHYNSVGSDLYVDLPLPRGDGVTLQFDIVRYDGGITFSAFPHQTTTLFEAGYFSKATRLAPFLQIARLDFTGSAPDQRQWLGGLAFFSAGQSLNLKFSYGKSVQVGSPARQMTQLTLQSLEF